MVQWNELHPYNAVHALRIPSPLAGVRLQNAINLTLERRGLSALELDRKRGTFCYFGGPAKCEFTLVAPGENPRAALVAEVERHINTPFASHERFCPFRFFAVPEADGFTFGLVYFHAAADAEAVATLLREILETFSSPRPPAARGEIELYPSPRAGLLRHHPRVWLRKLCKLPAQSRSLRRSCRALYCDPQDTGNGFTLFTLAPEVLRAVVNASKSWEVTLNDLFLAALIKHLAPLAAGRVGTTGRGQISVGCIVNLRRDLGVEGDRTFGLFLGSFVVAHAIAAAAELKAIAQAVRRQTAAIKRHRLYLATPLDLALANIFQNFSSLERQRKFYQRNHPLWGGVTNMNLNAIWKGSATVRPLDYFRAVSTGPVTPLVLSVTTAGDAAQIGLSWRTTVFSAEQIGRLKKDFPGTFAGLEPTA